MICDKCGALMIKRRGKFGEFWGCAAFPKCKNTQRIKYEAPIVERQERDWRGFTPSAYQAAIKAAVDGSSDNLLVAATAGSGKTTLLVWLAQDLPTGNNKFLAFNKAIALELAARLPLGVAASTLHSLGLGIIKANASGRVQVDPDKIYQFITSVIDMEDNEQKSLIAPVKKLVSVYKNTSLVMPPSPKIMADLCDDYQIETNGHENHIFTLATGALTYSARTVKLVDYDDMIWLPALHGWHNGPTDILMVDEAQDLNPVQLQLLQLLNANRYIFVGDANQSIYAFRGALVGAMSDIKRTFACVELPLSLCYRNSKAVVAYVNSLWPEIRHECLPTAPEGEVDVVSQDIFALTVRPRDLVLCRNNAPMVAEVFSLLKRGISATIRGRDIGNELVNLIAKMKANSLPELGIALDAYKQRKTGQLLARGKELAAEAVTDQIDTILAIAEEASDIPGLVGQIERLFSDEAKEQAVQFSTVHRAKGLEADTVFILRPDLMPSKKATSDEDVQQEQNIMFVAYTRATTNMYIIAP